MAAVSLKQVAEKSGVSGATVSRVLNGKEQDRIPLRTRERVQKIARELGYAPNVLARNLARQRTDTIGLMISELANPFFASVLKHVETSVFAAGYQILLDANSDGYSQYQPLHRISGWMVDGVLMWTTPSRNLARFLGDRAKDIPVVYLGDLREDGADAVAMDLYGAGHQATEHLLTRGYRRICYFSSYPAEAIIWPNNSILACQNLCREWGLKPEILVMQNPAETRSSGFAAGLSIAARPPSERPDAVICQNDWTALFVHYGLQQGGLRVPDDIALIGFDGIEDGKYLPNGPLTTVKMPIDALCQAALDLLIRRIAGDNNDPGQQIIIPMELIPGGTT